MPEGSTRSIPSVINFRIGMLDCLVEVWRYHEALARGPIVRTEPLPQLGVADGVLQIGSTDFLEHLHLGRIGVDDRSGEDAELPREVRVQVGQQGWRAPELGSLVVRIRRFSCWTTHCAVRWKSDSFPTRSTMAPTIWTAVDPGADHTDPRTIQGHLVVPT